MLDICESCITGIISVFAGLGGCITYSRLNKRCLKITTQFAMYEYKCKSVTSEKNRGTHMLVISYARCENP